jgi:hypothetical protein
MGTLVTKSQARNTQAEYTGEGLTINVNYTEDAVTSTLQSLNGTIYKTANMSYAGSFNGQLQDGEIQYNLSGVKSKDMAAVFAALADIEQQIKDAEQPVNGGSNAEEE